MGVVQVQVSLVESLDRIVVREYERPWVVLPYVISLSGVEVDGS